MTKVSITIKISFVGMAAWLSWFSVDKITLRRAKLVLGRVTIFSGHATSIYLSQPPSPTQPPILSGTLSEYWPKYSRLIGLTSTYNDPCAQFVFDMIYFFNKWDIKPQLLLH